MQCYSEFFRFDKHAHFVAFIVHIAALFDKRRDTINLPRLATQLKSLISPQDEADVATLLTKAAPFVSKVAILRHNLFAHRSATLTYADAFKIADFTPNELRDLTEIALKLVNRLLIARGLKDKVFHELALEDANAMLKALTR